MTPTTARTSSRTSSDARKQRRREQQRLEPQRHGRCRRAQVPRAALGADRRPARVDVPGRAEFGIVGRAAGMAEQRLAGCRFVAVVAIAHRGSQKGIS